MLCLTISCPVSMDSHVPAVPQLCFYHMHHLRVVQHCLTMATLQALVQAFVVSNQTTVMLYWLEQIARWKLKWLQSTQNTAVLLVFNTMSTSWWSHQFCTAPGHWLPIHQQFCFTITFLCRSVFIALLRHGHRNSAFQWKMSSMARSNYIRSFL